MTKITMAKPVCSRKSVIGIKRLNPNIASIDMIMHRIGVNNLSAYSLRCERLAVLFFVRASEFVLFCVAVYVTIIICLVWVWFMLP